MKSDVWTNFVQTSVFTVKALMISNCLYHSNFQTKTDMRVKICFYAKLCTQNKILASKMRNLKQQKNSAFAPLILKRCICSCHTVSEALCRFLAPILVHQLWNLCTKNTRKKNTEGARHVKCEWAFIHINSLSKSTYCELRHHDATLWA